MKVALVSDLHIHDWTEFREMTKDKDRANVQIPTRLRDCVEVFTDVGNHCIAHEIPTVVIGGDIFHKRGVLYTQAFNLVVEALAWWKSLGITTLVIDGNHDHANKVGTVHAVESLASAGLVQSISHEHGYENWHLSSDDQSGELVITGVSYCDNRARFEQRLSDAEEEFSKRYRDSPRIFVFHHGFKDARVGSALEYVVKEDIDPAVLDKFEHQYAFSGHYHRRQPIGGRENAMYIGSPLEHMRGDGGAQKGFLVYDSDTSEVELIPLKRPRFIKLTQQQIDDKDYAAVEGNFVDVDYKELPKTPNEFASMLRKLGARGVNVPPARRKKGATATRLNVDPTTDQPTLLTRFIEHINPTELDHDELHRLGMELLAEVSP